MWEAAKIFSTCALSQERIEHKLSLDEVIIYQHRVRCGLQEIAVPSWNRGKALPRVLEAGFPEQLTSRPREQPGQLQPAAPGSTLLPGNVQDRPPDLLAMLGGILMERLELSFSESKDFCVLFTDVFLEPCK